MFIFVLHTQTNLYLFMNIETFMIAILNKMSGINKCQHKFIPHIMVLFLSLRVRFNYLMFARHGHYYEQSYRLNFSKKFDFKTFNRHLIDQYCGAERILIFDPSYLSKSGKCTPGVGYFWSGSAGEMKWGLELGALAVGDVLNHTAMHYYASQTTMTKSEEISLRAAYAKLLVDQSADLQKISKVMVFDAFFSKKPFVDSICSSGFTLISRLQKNCYLRYAHQGEKRKGRGRPKVYGEKIDKKALSLQHFKLIESTDNYHLYEGIAQVRSLGRWCKIVILQNLKTDGTIKSVCIYCSTDKEMDGLKVYEYYRMRYQIEFLFRDSKGHLGLEDSQSRQKEAIDFHCNMSLTALNVAKAMHWYSIPKEERKSFSIADIKTRYSNELLLDRIISLYGKDPKEEKIRPEIMELYQLGRIAA